MAKKIKGIKIEIGGETTGFQKALKDLDRNANKTQNELKQVNKALKLDPKNTELVTQKQKLLKKATEETKTKLEALKDAKAKADEDMKNGTEINEEQYRKLQREIVTTEDKLGKLEKDTKDLKKTSKKSFDSVAQDLDKFGQKAEKAGKKLTKKVTAPIVAVGGASAKMSIDFEKSMAKVSTIADDTKVPMGNLEDSILNLSNQTGVSAELIAEDVYNAISAGQDTADAVAFVATSTNLAKAGFAESSQSLDLLTTIMNSYGLKADEVTDVSDILIQVQNKGKTTVAELSESMGKAIPTANANGVALEQLGTGYALMTSKGIKTAETTTYMNSMMNELGKSGTKASTALKEKTGKSFKELMDSGKSLGDVLAILDKSAKSNGESLTDMFGSAEAGKAGLILLGDGADTFNESLVEMEDSAGATDKAVEKVSKTSGEKLTKSLNEVKNAGLDLGDILAPTIDKISTLIKKVVERVSNLSPKMKETIVHIALAAAAIGPVTTAIGNLSQKVKGLKGKMEKLKKAGGFLKKAGGKIASLAKGFGKLALKVGKATIALGKQAAVWAANTAKIVAHKTATLALTIAKKAQTVAQTALNLVMNANPIGLIIIGIAALIAIFVVLWKKCDGFRNFIKKVGKGIKKVFFKVIGFIKNNWKGLLLLIINPFAGIFKLLYDNCDGFRNYVKGIWEKMKETGSKIANFFTVKIPLFFKKQVNKIKKKWADFKKFMGKLGPWVKEKFQNIWDDIKGVFSGVGKFFGGIWDTIKEKFTTIGSKIGSAVSGAFKGVINTVLKTAGDKLNGAIDMLNKARKFINKIPGVNIGKIGHINIPQLAKGGILSSGQAIVAEAGPELIQMMNGKTVVTPLTKTSQNTPVNKQGTSGNTVNANFYNQSLSAQQVVSLIHREMGTV